MIILYIHFLRKTAFIIFAFIFSQKGHSQFVSIELGVKWKKEKVYFDDRDSLEMVPYLAVVYRNYTSENIYFKRPIPKEKYLPIAWAAIISTNEDLSSLGYLNYSENYRLEISDLFSCKNFPTWVEFDTVDVTKEHEGALINNDLSMLYEIFKTQDLLLNYYPEKQLSCFNYPDKDPITHKEAVNLLLRYNQDPGIVNCPINSVDSISTASDQFVFIKSGEVEIQEINLLPFMIVKGSFEFVFPDKKLYEYVIVDAFSQKKVNLPDSIDNYKLYKSSFKSNSIKISFN